jgi:uncharacterized protein DUF4037
MPEFIPGAKLAQHFFHEAVKPILEDQFPGLRYSAALIGPGSEVLGFDTPMSADHHWGPRGMIFLVEPDFAAHRNAIHEVFHHKLPPLFRGYSTNFTPPDPLDNGTQLMKEVSAGPINHRVEIMTIRGFFRDYLAIDPLDEIDAADWLTFPQQKLRSIIAGAVYHDQLTPPLAEIRAKFSWYPRDVWLYLLASEWSRIDQEQPFVGRAGDAGDELGSRIIAARLVQHLMRLCFLMERQYAPYSKWFGAAFSKLNCAAALTPLFERVLRAELWQERENALCECCEIVASMHNALAITQPLPTEVSRFFGRPFKVIHAGAFTDALKSQISGPDVKRISTNIGGIDVFSDSTDLLEATQLRERLRSLYT